ncbi:hypothetical protein OXX59_007094 [Metschnikowia pulcherrima]
MSQQFAPTFHGYILTNDDALMVAEAALANKLPLVQRRPLDGERPKVIRSGNIFVFIEEMSEIKRWTDGVAWSASRILGRFLIYRKLDKNALLSKDSNRKAKGSFSKRKGSRDGAIPLDSDMRRNSYSSIQDNSYENTNNSSEATTPGTPIPVAQDRGLIKKTLSLSIPASESESGMPRTIHLISYFRAYDVLAGNLIRPSQTDLRDFPVSPSLWSAIRRSSLGGKLLPENEANYYLDSNYQLQNMTSVLVNEDRLSQAIHQEAQGFYGVETGRRFSSAYSLDALRPPQSAPVIPSARTPLRAPLSAPMRSPSVSSATLPHFFPPENEQFARDFSYEEPAKKRSRSLQTDSLNSPYSSVETFASEDHAYNQPLRRTSDFAPSYVPSSVYHPSFGGSIRSFRPEVPLPPTAFPEVPVLDTKLYGPEMFRGMAGAPHQQSHEDSILHGGYEQYSAPAISPGLNNRAFGVQMSQTPQRSTYLNSVPQVPFHSQQRWDSFPTATSAGALPHRLDAQAEEIEYEHPIYD